MNSSCKNATYDEYKEIATRVGQPRIQGNQTSTTLLREMNNPPSWRVVQESKWTQADPEILREMNKLPLFAVRRDYYKVHYLPNATSEEPMLTSGSDFKSLNYEHKPHKIQNRLKMLQQL